MHFVILQIFAKLTQTTTILLQIIYVCNPPKFIQKCQSGVLAGIVSSRWCALSGFGETSQNLLDQSLNPNALLIKTAPLYPLHLAKHTRQGLVLCIIII
jgi:hypothetical protein